MALLGNAVTAVLEGNSKRLNLQLGAALRLKWTPILQFRLDDSYTLTKDHNIQGSSSFLAPGQRHILQQSWRQTKVSLNRPDEQALPF